MGNRLAPHSTDSQWPVWAQTLISRLLIQCSYEQ